MQHHRHVLQVVLVIKYVVVEHVRHHRRPIVSVRSCQMTAAELYQRVLLIRNVVAERVRRHRYLMQISVRSYQKTVAELCQRVRAERNVLMVPVVQVQRSVVQGQVRHVVRMVRNAVAKCV